MAAPRSNTDDTHDTPATALDAPLLLGGAFQSAARRLDRRPAIRFRTAPAGVTIRPTALADDTVADRPSPLHESDAVLEAAVRHTLRGALGHADWAALGRFGPDRTARKARRALLRAVWDRLRPTHERSEDGRVTIPPDWLRRLGLTVADAMQHLMQEWAAAPAHDGPAVVTEFSLVFPALRNRDEWRRLDAWLAVAQATRPACALAVVLRVYAGLDEEDIVSITGLDPAAVTACLADAPSGPPPATET